MNNSYKPYNSSLYIKALLEKRRREEEQQRRLQAETQKQQEERKKSDKNWWQRTTDTMSELTSNINEGFLGFLDGINDATAYVYGAISGNHEKAQNWMNYDWQAPALNVINQLDIGSNLMSGDFFNGNYWQDWKNVGNAESSRESINQLHTDSWSAELGETWQNRYNSLTQGVGSALPAVALGGVGGALGLGAKGTKLLTMGSLGVSAFGGGASEALSDGATYGQAGLYGGFSAGTEILLESFNDSINGFKTNIAKNQVGKQAKKEVAGETLKELYKKGLNNVAKDTLKESTEQLTKQAIKETLKDMAGEGFEELASDLISPSIKALTYKGKEGLKEYTDPDTYVDAFVSFIGGMAGAGVGSGLQTGVGTAKYSAQGRKAIQTASEINQLQNEFNELYSEGVKNGATNTDLDNMVRDYTRAIKQKSAQLTSEISQIDPNEITKMRNTLNTVDRVKGKNTVAYSDANDDEQIKTVNQERVKTITQEYSRTAEDKYGEAVRRAFKYTGGTVNIVDSNKLKDIDYIEQTIGKPLSENEVNQILNRNSKALYVKGHVFVSNANRSQVNKLIVHEVISHGILDMDVKTRNEFLDSLRLNPSFTKKLNEIDDDVLRKYRLNKKEIRALLYSTNKKTQYKLSDETATDLEVAQSEVMAHFLEFLYDNGDISGLMNSLNKSRISKMLSNALSYLKTKGGSTQEAQRQLEKMIDKVRKNNINANTELQSQIKSSYNKEKRHPIFSSYNEARVYRDEVRKRKFRLKSYDEVGKQTIYTWENVFIVDPKNDYSFLRQYTSDEYYDLTHKGETGYDKTRNTTDNGIGENNGQKTGVTIVRTDSVGKEGTGNDSLLTRETKNNQGSMRGNKKSNEIESSIEDQLFVDEMIDEGVLIKLWDNDPNIKSALEDNSNQIDSEGNKLTKEQIEHFKNSKVRDEKGNLLVVYHGTMNPGFTVFDDKQGNRRRLDKNVNFFMRDKYVSADYTKSRYPIEIRYTDSDNFYRKEGGYSPNVYPVYLNMENPLIIDAKGAHWTNIKHNLENAEKVRSTDDIVRWAIEQGRYDGVIIKNVIDGENTLYEMPTPSDEYITIKSPNQIKHIDNKKPTSHNDIRFALDDSQKTPKPKVENTDTVEENPERDMKTYISEKYIDNTTFKPLEIDDKGKAELEKIIKKIKRNDRMQAILEDLTATDESAKYIWENYANYEDKDDIYGFKSYKDFRRMFDADVLDHYFDDDQITQRYLDFIVPKIQKKLAKDGEFFGELEFVKKEHKERVENLIGDVDVNKTIDIKVGGEGRTLKSMNTLERNYSSLHKIGETSANLMLQKTAKDIYNLYNDVEKSDSKTKTKDLKTISAYAKATEEFIRSKNPNIKTQLDECYDMAIRKQRKEERKQQELEAKAKQEVKQEVKTPKPKVVKKDDSKNKGKSTKETKNSNEASTKSTEEKVEKDIYQISKTVNLNSFKETIDEKTLKSLATKFNSVMTKLRYLNKIKNNNESTVEHIDANVTTLLETIESIATSISNNVSATNKEAYLEIIEVLADKVVLAKKVFGKTNDNIYTHAIIENTINEKGEEVVAETPQELFETLVETVEQVFVFIEKIKQNIEEKTFVEVTNKDKIEQEKQTIKDKNAREQKAKEEAKYRKRLNDKDRGLNSGVGTLYHTSDIPNAIPFEEEQFEKLKFIDSISNDELDARGNPIKQQILGKRATKTEKGKAPMPTLHNLTAKDIEIIVRVMKGERLTFEELWNTDIIQRAERYNNETKDKAVLKKNEVPSQELLELFNEINTDFLKGYEDKTKGKVAELIIGLPSSGKSTAIANKVKKELNAFELDNDIIKESFPEFADGKGANNCQNASSYISENMALPALLKEGTNLVVPVVGKTKESLQEKIDLLKANDYKINLRYVEISKQEALNRAFLRFVFSGRYVSLGYIESIETNGIEANYEYFKNSKEIEEYGRYDNSGKNAISRETGISKKVGIIQNATESNQLDRTSGDGRRMSVRSERISEESGYATVHIRNVSDNQVETEETTTNVVETPTETHEVAQETTFSDETISKITNKKKQEIKKIKVIIQNTRRVATKTVSSVKAEADFYNKVVYSVESDAKPLREKISKYLSTKGQEFVANGKGTNLVDFEVLCVMDSIDSNLSLEKRVEKIYEIYAQFIKVDKNITNYIKREIRKALENGGKPSKMAKLKAEFEAKNMKNVEAMQIQVDNLLGKLTTAQEQVEIYKSQVTELQNEVNKITSENTKNDKETAKEIKKLKTELNKVNAKLTDKESTNAELKSQIKEVKAEIKASKEALTKKEKLINYLKEKTQKAQTEKVEAKTEVQGKKVVSQDFRDTLELTDVLKDFKTVGEVKMSDKLYEDIALHLSKGHIKTAVNMYLTFVGNIKVEVDGVTQTLKDSSAEWAEFESQIRKAFEDYYDTAKKSTAVEIQEENEALTYATVAVIKASFAIKRKLNKKTGVIQPLKPLAKNLVSKISKVSITSLKNGTYRKAIKELHDELITKKDGMSILDRIDYEFDKELLDKMNRFGNGKGKLTKQDMYDIMDIMRGFSVFLSKASGATLYDGKTVSQHSVDAIQMQKKNGVHKWKPVLNAVSPRVVFEYMDSYKEDGFNTYVYNKLLDGEVVEQQSYLELFGILDKFYKSKDGKKVKGKLLDEVSIKVDGWNHEFTATVGEYMSIYKLLNREDAKKHLLKSGLCLRRQKKSRLGKITGKKQYEFIEQRFTEETLENFKKAIEEKFNLNSDDSMYKKFIDVTTEFFEKAKEYKMDTDKATRGYTNVIKGEEYFPIKVVAFDMLMNMGENQDFMSSAMAGSRNFSFNASVEGSKGMLEISNILDVMNVYGNQMAKYRAYAETIDMINSVFNYKLQTDDVSEGLYVGETLRNIMAHTFGANGNKHSNVIEYYNNLLRDLQGIREYDEALLEKIRKNFASFQLGANLKVMANQLSAIPTMLKYISLDNFVKAHKTLVLLGFDTKAEDMPETAQYRMKLHQALSTNMITDNIGKAQGFFGKGMEFSDNVVLKMVWTACKMQAKNDLVKAEKLFNKIIRETQGFNTLQRSQLLRSNNSIVRFLMMFKVQPSHNLSNLVECIQHIRANKQTGNKMTKEQKRMYTGAVVGLLLEGAMYTAIGLLFKRLLGRDEEDDLEIQNILETFFNDNMIGMIPFLDQIEVDFDKDSGKFLKINELNVSALQQVSDALTDLQNATDKEAHISERITSYANAIGRLTGIPTRNINNYTTMFLKKIVPDFAFKWEIESNGYTLSNKSQVNSALTNNQNEKAWQYYKNYNNKIVELDDKTNEIMFDLYKEGYKDVYVKQIPSTMDTTTATITVDKDKFKRTYSKLTIPLKRMTNNYMFKELSKIEQEEVLQRLVDCYYNIAYKEQSKKQMTLLESLASDGFDINKYLIHITKISNFEGTIGMSKKDIAVEYIDRLHLTKDEKNLLYLLAGYSVGQEALDNVIKYLKARGVSYITLKRQLMSDDSTVGKIIRARSY